MKIRIGLLVLTVALVFALATPANAGCSPAQQFGQIGGPQQDVFTYTYFSSGADLAGTVGRFWQPGQRSAVNEGPCPTSAWWFPFGAAGEGYMNGLMGGLGCANNGCPAGSLLILLQVPNSSGGAEFVVGQVNDTPAQTTRYDYTVYGAMNGAPIPRPTVVSSSRGAGVVNITLNVHAATGGQYGNIGPVGYQIVRAQGTADPGRGAAAWTLVQNVAAGADTPLTADCATPSIDQFYATRMTFNNGEFASDLVSAPVRVNCNPALADPNFKLIDKKPAVKKEVTRQ